MLDLRTVRPGSLLEVTRTDVSHLIYLENGKQFRPVLGDIFMYLGYEVGSLEKLTKMTGASSVPGIGDADLLYMDILFGDKVGTILVSYFPPEEKNELPSDFYAGNYLINWAAIARPAEDSQQE